MHRYLFDPAELLWTLCPGQIQHRENNVDRMVELAADAAGLILPARPAHDERHPDPAAVGVFLVVLQWCVAGCAQPDG